MQQCFRSALACAIALAGCVLLLWAAIGSKAWWVGSCIGRPIEHGVRCHAAILFSELVWTYWIVLLIVASLISIWYALGRNGTSGSH
jgi:hypothetical protein